MRSRVMWGLILCAGLIVTTSAIGQDRDKKKGGGRNGWGFPFSELKVSDDQKTKIEDVQKDYREKINKLREEEQKAISKVLTDEQKEKYEKILKERKERMDKMKDRRDD